MDPTPLRESAAWVFGALCGGAIAFHLALITGRPWGHLTMGGRWSGSLPVVGRVLSALSVVILVGMAIVVLSLGGQTKWTPPTWLTYLTAAYLALAILAHLATPSLAERRLWLPVIFGMAGCLALILSL